MATTNETYSSGSNIDSAYLQNVKDLNTAGQYTAGTAGAQYTPEQLAAANATLQNQINSLFNPTQLTNNNFGMITDYNQILNNMNAATNAAYNQQRTEAQQNLNAVNAQNAANRAQTIQAMRNNLMTSALNGANAGQVNANILSSYLANQANGAAAQTAALQNLQNIAEQRRSGLIENANNALTTANNAASTLGNLKVSEQGNRAQVAANALYNMGNLAGNMATVTKATETGNINSVNTTSPYKTTSSSTTS